MQQFPCKKIGLKNFQKLPNLCIRKGYLLDVCLFSFVFKVWSSNCIRKTIPKRKLQMLKYAKTNKYYFLGGTVIHIFKKWFCFYNFGIISNFVVYFFLFFLDSFCFCLLFGLEMCEYVKGFSFIIRRVLVGDRFMIWAKSEAQIARWKWFNIDRTQIS